MKSEKNLEDQVSAQYTHHTRDWLLMWPWFVEWEPNTLITLPIDC